MKIGYSFRTTCLLLTILALAACQKNEGDGGGTLAVIVTSVVDVITPVSATCSGNITASGNSAPTERGVCWGEEPTPDITDNKTSDGSGTGEFSFLMTGLSPQTTYYARAYATNKAGTAYGDELVFTTPEDHSGETGTVTDVDGNIYQTIGIGSQFWTAENLKTTRFNDGTAIPQVTDNSTWQSLAGAGYCWYNNDEANKEAYGALYNWFVVVSSKLSPSGWHVSSDAEWTILETFLGGLAVTGGKLKETGTDHWLTPNSGATNETGFTAVPGGRRSRDGSFDQQGENANIWTNSTASNLAAWYRSMNYSNTAIARTDTSVNFGFSVRLVKD